MDKFYKTIIYVLTLLNVSMVLDGYQLGTTHYYNLSNKVRLNDIQITNAKIEYDVNAKVKVSVLWKQNEEILLKLEISSPGVVFESPTTNNHLNQNANLHSAAQFPFYVYLNSGKITKLLLNAEENPNIVNFKKSIASLFQYQTKNTELDEDDIAGSCNVKYIAESAEQFTKTKQQCVSDKPSDEFKRLDGPLAINITPKQTIAYEISSDGSLKRIKHHEIFVTNLSKTEAAIESNLVLNLDKAESGASPLTGANIDEVISALPNVVATPILIKLESSSCLSGNCKTFPQLIKSKKSHLAVDKIGTEELATNFNSLLKAALHTSKDDFLRVLNARSTQVFKGNLLDILGAAQTIESHEAVKQAINFKAEDATEHTERYFQALAVSSNPKEAIIEDLLTLTEQNFNNEKVYDTLIQAIASMAYRFSILHDPSYSSEIIQKVEKFITSSIKTCEDVTDCQLIYIRALQNLRSIKTIPILFQYIDDQQYEKSVSRAAMKALRKFPADTWTPAYKKHFESIFYQIKQRYDSTVRTIALDVLLTLKPSSDELQTMLDYLKSNDKMFEVKQYLLQRILMLADECPEFRAKTFNLIQRDRTMNNYNIFGQKGLSTALSRQFSGSPSFNASLISLQEMSGGVLKTGTVDLIIDPDNQRYSIFSLGMYAGGLSSFVGDSNAGSNDDDDDFMTRDNEPSNAGMEVIVQGSFFRPIQFFKGQSELMGHVWSGTASNPTPAYQATTVLQNYKEYIRLNNGAVVIVNVIGSISIDLNGQITFSLWNRNAKSLVRKYSAYAISMQVKLDAGYMTVKHKLKISEEPKLDLQTDIDFSGKVMLCMQLSQPNTVLRQNLKQIIEIPNKNYKVKKIIRSHYNLPGLTHKLNQKNNEMCNEILS